MLRIVPGMRSEGVEAIEAELVKLHRQSAVLRAEIDTFAARQGEAEDAAELRAATEGEQIRRNRLRKLGGRISEAEARLDAARAAVRAKLEAELSAACHRAGQELLQDSRSIYEIYRRYVAARDALQAAGFIDTFHSKPIPPARHESYVIAPDLLDLFDAGLNPAPRVPAPPRRQPIPTPHRAPEPGEAAYVVSIAPPLGVAPLPAKARPAPRALRDDTAGEGEDLVRVMLSGFLLPDGDIARIGDVIALPHDVAMALLLTGKVDTVDASSAAPAAAGEGGPQPAAADVAVQDPSRPAAAEAFQLEAAE